MNDTYLPTGEPPGFERHEREQAKLKAKQDAANARATNVVCRTKPVREAMGRAYVQVMENRTYRERTFYEGLIG